MTHCIQYVILPPVNEPRREVRKVTCRGTPSYQLGHYEMRGEKGKRRSAFKVHVHLGEYETPEDALSVWPTEIERLRGIGREKKAENLEAKVKKLRSLL